MELFASEEATVKIGTVIDPDMGDELHVTVVATGLSSRTDKPTKVVDNTLQAAAAAPQAPRSRSAGEPSAVNYHDLERPTVMRNQAQAAAMATKPNTQEDLDYLDIPAFIRRQAD